MTNIAKDAHIASPIGSVFAVLADVERLSELSEMTVDVKNGPGRAVQVGDRFDQVVKILGVEVDTEWEVTEIVADERIRFEGRSKANGRASLVHTLRPEGDGCVARIEVDYDPPFGLLGDLADKLVFERRHEDEAEQILAKLKTLCERPVAA